MHVHTKRTNRSWIERERGRETETDRQKGGIQSVSDKPTNCNTLQNKLQHTAQQTATHCNTQAASDTATKQNKTKQNKTKKVTCMK